MVDCIKETQKQDQQYVILRQKVKTELDSKFMINETRVPKRKGQLWVPLSVCNDLLHQAHNSSYIMHPKVSKCIMI